MEVVMEEKVSKIIENLKSGNYEVVDNQGVSVIVHFVECLEKEFTDLEAKIAEKDKEIAYLTKQVRKFNNEAQKYFEDAYCNDFHNQDKISFAIAELEKVKDYAQHIQGGLINYIENQINRLKGEK